MEVTEPNTKDLAQPDCKQTEVGMIPEDWTLMRIADVATTVASGRSSVDSQFGEFPVYGSTGVIGRSIKGDYAGRAILVARVGANAGTLNVVDGEYGVTDNTIILRIGDSVLWSYVWRQLAAKRLNSMVFGSGQPLITGSQIKSLLIPVPPTKIEQEAIAEALNDADALIESLEQLLDEKRQLKQGTMQELLTGKKRLPGFEREPGTAETEVGLIPNDWEVATLAAVCSMKSGEGITSSSIDPFSKYPCFGGNGLRGFTARFTHDGRYALIGRVGALCGNVLGVEGRFFASEHAIVVAASTGTDERWLTFVLGEMRLNQYSESSAQPVLTVSKLLRLQVARPQAKAEQDAIATVLSEMDAEVAALEAKLAKARQLKQGMMQELLTGKIRLV